MIAPARTAAHIALRAVYANRTDLPSALVRSRELLTDERDRALAADIVTGTLRWQRSLDHLIVHFARRPIDKLDLDVLTILRLSLYQVLHLTRVPASAAVDDAVSLARAARKTSATGFVNAVLRSTLRERHRLPLPPVPADSGDRAAALAYLGITHSHPDWLVSRWLDRYGFDACERWVRFNNETPQLALRANRLRATRDVVAQALADDGIATAPTPFAADGLLVTEGNPLRRPLDGSFFVQDEASQLVPLTVAAQPGERVLDLCASPGGKTTALAAAMNDTGRLVACDVRTRRVDLLRDTVARSGAQCVEVAEIDPAAALPFDEPFQRVLVDAPCSGLGTIRRDPDIRWKRRDDELPALAAAQGALLDRAAAAVAPGGRLVYATCSSEPEENEEVIQAFLRRHTGFQLHDLRQDGPSALTTVLDDQGMLRTLPFAHGLEAFFAAAVVRSSR